MAVVYYDFCDTRLTLHEMQIIAFLCTGLSRKMIAGRLGNSPGTLNQQLNKIFLKTRSPSAVTLVGKAIENGFSTGGLYKDTDIL